VADTENIYASSRFNWSSSYAMEVIELAEAVQVMAWRVLQDDSVWRQGWF
jgi:membrane-bound lytic murein transglycosylase B